MKGVSAYVRDLSGLRFGRWFVLEVYEVRKTPFGKGVAWWLCRCDCRTERWVRSNSLVQEESLSCGCAQKKSVWEVIVPPKRPKFRDLTGQRFGRLIALSFERCRTKQGASYYLWSCICDCGDKAKVRGPSLVTGMTRSCGCLRRESVAIAQAASRGPGSRGGQKACRKSGPTHPRGKRSRDVEVSQKSSDLP